MRATSYMYLIGEIVIPTHGRYGSTSRVVGVVVLGLLLRAPSPSPTDGGDSPTWADQLEAWATLGGAIVALAAAIATFWLLIHQIRETRLARGAAHQERVEAAADRELARQDRELATAERRDAEAAQARTVIVGGISADATRKRHQEALILQRAAAWIENFGAEPVTDVTFVISTVSTPSNPVDATTNEHMSVLAPRERLDISWEKPRKGEAPPIGIADSYYRDETGGHLIRVEARFTDIAGRRWVRVNGGLPARVFDRQP
ncbi:hypothetical protein Ahu01nite_079750 [Winogradskya humida]|uniref:Secreted protein n=1 Tax=Winogradskya humida TaxID=113566 RepID=A0ABQ4A209_9ACTN|nr:hypothetical protein Ahu01nite_079750 [Actinoplanes humidus]